MKHLYVGLPVKAISMVPGPIEIIGTAMEEITFEVYHQAHASGRLILEEMGHAPSRTMLVQVQKQ